MPLYPRYLFSIPRLCDWINISQAAPRPFFSLTNWGGGKESFRPARRTINIKVIPLEVLQSGAPYVHCQTRALVPFLSLPRLTLAPYLSIHPSRLICCAICAAVISRTPHVLPFTPLLSLFPSWFWLSPSHQARPPPPCEAVWLTRMRPTMERACSHTKKKKKEKCLRRLLSHITSCHYSAKPGPVNKQRLHLAAETHARKRKCDNLTRGMYKIALNYSIKTNHLPSRTEERAAPRLTIRVLGSSTLLIGACHHSNIPLSWIMEKICVKYCVWFFRLRGSNTTTTKNPPLKTNYVCD